MVKQLLILAALIIFCGCSTLPLTGRKQINLVPNAELLPLAGQQYREVMSDFE